MLVQITNGSQLQTFLWYSLIMLLPQKIFCKPQTCVVGCYRFLSVCSWASSTTQLRSVWPAELMAAKVGHRCLSDQGGCTRNCPLVLLRSLECCTPGSETFCATWSWFLRDSKHVKMLCWISVFSFGIIRTPCVKGASWSWIWKALQFLRAKQPPLTIDCDHG